MYIIFIYSFIQHEFIIYILYILYGAVRGVQCDADVADVLHMCPHAAIYVSSCHHACVLRQVPGSGLRIVIRRWHGNSSRNSSSKSRKSEKSRFPKRTWLNILHEYSIFVSKYMSIYIHRYMNMQIYVYMYDYIYIYIHISICIH